MEEQEQAKGKDCSRKNRLEDVAILLLGAGSFGAWFLMVTMLGWVVIRAITIDSAGTAVTLPTLRTILEAMSCSMRICGTKEPTPAVLTHCINIVLFCFNMIVGWRWIKRKQTGRFALLLLSETLLIIFALLTVALHMAASPYAATRNSFGIMF